MTTRFADHLLVGVIGDRPAATAVPAGTLYSSTDEGLVYQSDGASWDEWATLGGGGGAVATDTIFDAKGDLAAGTAADAAARLAVGTNGQVLTADSAETTGIKWATPSAGAAGALTLLHTLTLGSAGTFDQSSISGSYNDLVLVLIARSSGGSVGDTVSLRFNNDSGGNYYRQRIRTHSTTLDNAEVRATSLVDPGYDSISSAPANVFGVTEITVFGYASTTWMKVWHSRSYAQFDTAADNQYMYFGSGQWQSTAAINRVAVSDGSLGNFATGSQLRIYGRL